MRRVIVNSTPLIVLSNIGRLELLHELYQEIYIPQAVYREVTEKNDKASLNIQNALNWIHVENIQNPEKYMMYKAKLHAGEVEVMILAQETPAADLVIIDDNAARKTAKFLGLNVTGTIGVLLKAKIKGLIPEVKPILNELQANGFYISEQVVKIILKNDPAGRRRFHRFNVNRRPVDPNRDRLVGGLHHLPQRGIDFSLHSRV